MSTHYCVTEHWAGDWFHFRGHDCRCSHWTIDVAWARCLKADWDKWHKCHRDGPPTPSSDSKVTIVVWKGVGWLNTFIPSSVLQTPLSEELRFWFPSLLHLHLTSVHNSTGPDQKVVFRFVTCIPAIAYHSCLASICMNNSRNLGPTFYPSSVLTHDSSIWGIDMALIHNSQIGRLRVNGPSRNASQLWNAIRDGGRIESCIVVFVRLRAVNSIWLSVHSLILHNVKRDRSMRFSDWTEQRQKCILLALW